MSEKGRRDKEITNVPGSSGYSYRDMSSLVIQTDRSEIVRRDREAGSDLVESIWGRVNPTEMGSRVSRESAPSAKRSDSSGVLGLRPAEPISAEDYAQLKYRPRSRETRTAYEHLLVFLQREADFVDQPAAVVRSAADEVLAVLKATEESWKDLDRKTRIEETLGLRIDMSSDKYAQLVNLGRRITDYQYAGAEDEDGGVPTEGVAVVFDDDETGDVDANGAEQDDFGLIPNLVDDEEAEAEFERTLPIAGREAPASGPVVAAHEDRPLNLEALAFPEGIAGRLYDMTRDIAYCRRTHDDQQALRSTGQVIQGDPEGI